MQPVTLVQRETAEVSVNLTAEVNSEGELVLSGQDLGPFVEKMMGDMDYEYWTTVASDQKQKVLVLLLQDAFNDLLELRSWFKSAGIEYRSAVTTVFKESFSVEANERHIAIRKEPDDKNPTGSVFFIDRYDEDKLLLLLLQELFKRKVFSTDSDFTAWLKKHDIEYEFCSYV